MNVSKAKKVKKGQKGPNTLFSTFSLPGKGKKISLPGTGKKFSLPGIGKNFSLPGKEKSTKKSVLAFLGIGGKGKFFFFPLLEIFLAFFDLFWLKRLKTPISSSKRGGKFFPGGVRKHELGVGNYRQSGRNVHSLM